RRDTIRQVLARFDTCVPRAVSVHPREVDRRRTSVSTAELRRQLREADRERFEQLVAAIPPRAIESEAAIRPAAIEPIASMRAVDEEKAPPERKRPVPYLTLAGVAGVLIATALLLAGL